MALRSKILPVFVHIAHISLKSYPKQDIILAQDQFCLSLISCTSVNLIYFIHCIRHRLSFFTRIFQKTMTGSKATLQPEHFCVNVDSYNNKNLTIMSKIVKCLCTVWHLIITSHVWKNFPNFWFLDQISWENIGLVLPPRGFAPHSLRRIWNPLLTTIFLTLLTVKPQ